MSTLTSWVVPYQDLPRGDLRISRGEFRWVMAILLILLSVVLFEIVRVWLHYEIHVDGVPVNPLNYYTP